MLITASIDFRSISVDGDIDENRTQVICTHWSMEERIQCHEVQLLLRDRMMLHVIEYFAKSLRSLKVILNDTLEKGAVSPY